MLRLGIDPWVDDYGRVSLRPPVVVRAPLVKLFKINLERTGNCDHRGPADAKKGQRILAESAQWEPR